MVWSGLLHHCIVFLLYSAVYNLVKNLPFNSKILNVQYVFQTKAIKKKNQTEWYHCFVLPIEDCNGEEDRNRARWHKHQRGMANSTLLKMLVARLLVGSLKVWFEWNATVYMRPFFPLVLRILIQVHRNTKLFNSNITQADWYDFGTFNSLVSPTINNKLIQLYIIH